MHIGSTMFHEEGFEELCSMMNGSYKSCTNNYGVCHGDTMETIMIDDYRYRPETTKGDPMYQMNRVVEYMQPIKNKLIVICSGNHEDKLWRFGDITKKIADDLGTESATGGCHITYKDKDGKIMYKHYAIHGSKSINSTADDPVRQWSNMKLSLKRHLHDKFGDTILCSKGHTHKLITTSPSRELYMKVVNGKIKQSYKKSSQTADQIHKDHRYYVNTGSFMRLYGDDNVTGYAERWELSPVELGFAICVVRDGIIQGVDKIVI
jgi:hypothetical protein